MENTPQNIEDLKLLEELEKLTPIDIAYRLIGFCSIRLPITEPCTIDVVLEKTEIEPELKWIFRQREEENAPEKSAAEDILTTLSAQNAAMLYLALSPLDSNNTEENKLDEILAFALYNVIPEDYPEKLSRMYEVLTAPGGSNADVLTATKQFAIDFVLDPDSTAERIRDKNNRKLSHVKSVLTGDIVTVKPAPKVDYPTDKVNHTIWRLKEDDLHGQMAIAMENNSDRKKNKEINLYYSIDFGALANDTSIKSTIQRLTTFDKRIYIALAALFNAGNEYVSLSRIWQEMGGKQGAATNQLKKINDAITKMTCARININNAEEAAAYKYEIIEYEGSLLPIEREIKVINGRLVDGVIHIFREPPLVSFARNRKQITTVDIKVLQSPMNKTEGNLAIDDYLIERISRAKSGHQSRTIVFNTVCEHAGITTVKAKQRAPEKIKNYLTHYKEVGFIRDFTIDKTKAVIYF